MNGIAVTEQLMQEFEQYLYKEEKSSATARQYLRAVRRLASYLNGRTILQKEQLVDFKNQLAQQGYAAASINSTLAAVNCLVAFAGRSDWKLRFLKLQRTNFCSGERELAQSDYQRLVEAARRKKDERLELLVQTICATGIRVSELKAVTAEALSLGRAQITCKGKVRSILLPKMLCTRLRGYCRKQKIRHGSIFITRSGNPLDRSNIWKMMKKLCKCARVEAAKVYPHNLRHLFARTFYKKYKDVVGLADLLGHSSVNTTRIYTLSDGREQYKQLSRMCLLL